MSASFTLVTREDVPNEIENKSETEIEKVNKNNQTQMYNAEEEKVNKNN